ncbi:response regulator transcription factor [Cellulomonas sp. APG4]|uniref:response regulator n=1 Tax=Cellulomonas sp. APG4 TaxID=1538656 RepID=UPI001379B9CC|nr:response regulator transcription factor [Cellulomonas sp. APG4]NCT92096.1 response regulator transcription factor [Cellulomonas sp. APG4]
MIRVLLADDHGAIRAGLRLMLETADDVVVVGEAADGEAAVRNARALRPDVVLMDVRMPGTDGIEATRHIAHEGLADVLVLTTFDIDEYVLGALRAGAAGFLLKSVDAPSLLDAVRRVGAGEGVVAPEVTRRVLAELAARAPVVAPPAPPGLDTLTDRERDVLACLGEGLSNAALARALDITEATAKTHVSRVLAKLECASRVQAAILARDLGVVRT